MIGQTISHYRILEKLGEGGMGVVYKAHDTKLDRDVALKFLPATVHPSPEELTRFEQEAKAISSLNHANIATIYDVDEYEGPAYAGAPAGKQRYLVLEFIPGGTLKSRLKYLKSEDQEFSFAQVIDYGIQAAEALAHAHRHQIIHRDVKTDNLMLTDEGKLKLTDFGLAKLRGNMKLTKTGSTVGTAAYMSPEQIRGEETDARSDIFSLGVVLYELVTSHLPFRGEFETALSYSILNENHPSVRSLRKDCPPALEKIIVRCLEKDKTKRYQTADEIVTDLRKISGEVKTVVVKQQSKLPWIIAAAVVVVAAVGIYLFTLSSHPTGANSKTIAVLPFENMSDSKEDEYFSDGITDDILMQLSKIADLNVISRTSVMQYKGTKKTVRDIGKELNAGVILEGSVRRAGDQVRIVAQLIDASQDKHMWAETYDREFKQVFAIQSEIAQKIAGSLQATLSPAEKDRINKKPTENTEAYQLYLKGRFYWNKRRAEDLEKAIDYFQQAIDKDPNYALAYAGLASVYVVYASYSGRPTREYAPKAMDAAEKALGLDGTLAESHAVLAILKQEYEWDWEGAEKEYTRAIALNPNLPTAHQWYAICLMEQERIDEALAELQRAQALDPLSLVISSNLGDTYYFMRQYDKALDQYKKTLDLDPNFPNAHAGLGNVYGAQGKLDDAIAESQKTRTLAPSDLSVIGDLGRAFARAGRKNDALLCLNQLLKMSKQGYSVPAGIAEVYVALDDKDKAFEWLKKAYEERDAYLQYLKVDAEWDNLRTDPRYHELLKKIRLEK